MSRRPEPHADDLDLAGAAERLGVHYQTAYQWVRDGTLPARRVGRRYRIDARELDEVARRRAEPRRVPQRARPRRWDCHAARLEQALVGGDERTARNEVLTLRDQGIPASEIIQEMIVPALAAIGDGWVAGTVGIPEEHRASAIVGRLLGELSPRPRGRPRGTVVVATVSGDHHGLPTAMAAAALAEDRWRVQHLGSDVPEGEVLRFATEEGVDLVVLTVTNDERAAASERLRRRLVEAGIPTIVGEPGRTLSDLQALARAQAPSARRHADEPGTRPT